MRGAGPAVVVSSDDLHAAGDDEFGIIDPSTDPFRPFAAGPETRDGRDGRRGRDRRKSKRGREAAQWPASLPRVSVSAYFPVKAAVRFST